jgi:hypothetical protein
MAPWPEYWLPLVHTSTMPGAEVVTLAILKNLGLPPTQIISHRDAGSRKSCLAHNYSEIPNLELPQKLCGPFPFFDSHIFDDVVKARAVLSETDRFFLTNDRRGPWHIIKQSQFPKRLPFNLISFSRNAFLTNFHK